MSCAKLIAAAFVGLLLAACGATDADDTAEPVGDTTSKLTGCSLSRAKILASASAGRKKAVERGFAWLDDDVPYSQSASHEGYRTDCSGFVSMCWSLGRSSNTAAFYRGDANRRLGSYSELVVADALVKQGHIVLFLGWNDAAQSGACVLEQASTASDMQLRVRSRASLDADGYKPIRASSLAGEPAPAPAPKKEPAPKTPEPAPAAEPEPEPAPAPSPSAPSSVSTQSEDSGDEGDPDEAPAARNLRSDPSLASGGCAIAAAPSSLGGFMPLATALVLLLVRRRRLS